MLYTQIAAHEAALRCHRRLDALLPNHPDVLRGLAAAETSVGLMDEAEAHLDRAIALDPGEFDAYYNRAVLRRQAPSHHHVDQLRQVLAGPARGTRGEIPVCYALAKELEDLGDHAASFACLKRGADGRRAVLSYRVESDLAAIDQIVRSFDRPIQPIAEAPPPERGRPLFVLGLPRSGTTLVEQILAAHPAVEGLGELTEFPMALMRLLPGIADRAELIRRASRVDGAALGRSYLEAASGYRTGRPCFVDKLPSNFLYLGLIRLALPGAAIVHLRRQPMDALYAIYKTLFRMGYPYSYSPSDLARYYAAYRRLMAHWDAVAPGAVLHLDYEALVREPEPNARRLLEASTLPWDPACLAFHAGKTPVATASAAQVREPIHARSVGLWRRYERELAPLAAALEAEGIDPLGPAA
jgi:tetratricopeptide (TPR) repeat protein